MTDDVGIHSQENDGSDREVFFADFKGDPFTLMKENTDDTEEIAEGFLYVVGYYSCRKVSFDEDSDDMQYGMYSLSEIKAGSDFRDLDQIIDLEPETAFFKTSAHKAGPYSKENFTDYFPADWVDLYITWYQDSSGEWKRANNSEMTIVAVTQRPIAGWIKMYELSFSISSEGIVDTMFILYGDAEDVVRFECS